MTQIDNMEKCSECSGRNVRENEIGELECQDCGLIMGMTIDMGKDNRVFADGSGAEGERWGQPKTELLHDGGLTTDMAPALRDGTGAALSPSQRRKYNRLRRQHQRTRIRDAKERNLVTALNELDRLAGQMSLPRSIREDAARIYKQAVYKKLVRGRSIEGVVAACIHASCRMNHMARTLDEIGMHSRTGRKEIGRTFKKVMKELQIRIYPAPPSEYVPRFCSHLQLDAVTEGMAKSILGRNEINGLSAGRGPIGIAAAAVYLSARINGIVRTQREVSLAAGVTEVTIRNRYKEICSALAINPDTPQPPQ